MARIEHIQYEERDIRDQEVVKATYSVAMINSEVVFQINTYGRSTRISEGVPSQIIQFNKETAIELIKVLQDKLVIKEKNA